MIEINLIPDVKQELLKAQRARAIVISASIITSIVAAGIVVLLSVYIFGVQWGRGLYLDGQIDSKGKEFAQVEDLSKILTIQNQLKIIPELNDKKNMETRVFDVISAITPSDPNGVSFSQITVGASEAALLDPAAEVTGGGQIQLQGQTSGYDAMEVFKKTLENTTIEFTADDVKNSIPLATNISSRDISYGEDSEGRRVLRFTLTFDYPAELLSPKSSNVSFKLNVNGNVTDSYLGIPRFEERAKDIEGEQ